MLVNSFLEDSAARRPGAVALVCGSRRLTYRQLDEAADRVACGLQSLGLRRGDRVVIHLENSVDTVLAIFGTLKAGGVFVLVNPTVKSEKLSYLLGDSGAVVIVSDPRARDTVTEALAGSTSLKAVIMTGSGADTTLCGRRCVSFDSLIEREGVSATVRLIDEDLAALIYTSGSTGLGKGVMLTHSNMVAAATSIEAYLGNTADDVILNVLPLSFDYGLYQIFLAVQGRGASGAGAFVRVSVAPAGADGAGAGHGTADRADDRRAAAKARPRRLRFVGAALHRRTPAPPFHRRTSRACAVSCRTCGSSRCTG